MTEPLRTADWRRFLRFWGRNVDDDVADELRFHLERRIAALVASGVSPADAERQALERFGDLEAARRECAEIDRGVVRVQQRRSWLMGFRYDLTFAFRILRRQKLTALVIVLCLALGVGAATTVFSVGDALLVRPLPFPNGSRLVDIGTRQPDSKRMGVSSLEDFTDWQVRQRSFETMALYKRESPVFVGPNETVRVPGTITTSGMFSAIGVRPLRGRFLRASDDVVGAPPVVVVSESFAKSRLSGVDSAVGQVIRLSGRSYDVIGVVRQPDAFPDGNDLWRPLGRTPDPNRRGSRSYEIVAALRPDFSLAQARADLAAVSSAVSREHPADDNGVTADIEPLRDRYVATSRSAFFALAAAASLLLLIACANVASLQLARTSARAREIALRTALGAERGRVLRQLLTESVILATIGGALGIVLTMTASGVVTRAIPAQLATWMKPGIDARLLAFTLLISVVSGIAFGIAPALRLLGVAPANALHGRGGLDPRRIALQRGFVVAEIALSLVLVVGATLAAESAQRLIHLDPGFDRTDVLTLRLAIQGPRYESDEAKAALVEQLDDRIKALSGVQGAGAASHMPIADCCSKFGMHLVGEPTSMPEHMVTGNVVTPGFFRAMRIPLMQGRYLTDADRRGAQNAIVINETFARELLHDAHPVGKVVHRGSDDVTIVGVVHDVKQRSFTDNAEPQFYLANAQVPWDAVTFAVHVKPGATADVVRGARKAMRELDASLPIYRALPLTELLERDVASQRMFGLLLAGVAMIALVLATAGIYGITSHYVAQRTAELGIRIALGAEPGRLVALVLRQGATLSAMGVLIGLAGAAITARVLTRVLWGVSAGEPLIYLTGAAVLGGMAAVACIGPAVRASRADPMQALRAE